MENNLSTVTIPVEEYNGLRDRIADLERANGELTEVIENTKDMDDSRVIIKEVYTGEDEDGDECRLVKYSFKNFEDVKAEVEDVMKDSIEGATKKLGELTDKLEDLKKDLKKSREERIKALEELKQKSIELQCFAAKLRNRNWWQRLLNK